MLSIVWKHHMYLLHENNNCSLENSVSLIWYLDTHLQLMSPLLAFVMKIYCMIDSSKIHQTVILPTIIPQRLSIDLILIQNYVTRRVSEWTKFSKDKNSVYLFTVWNNFVFSNIFWRPRKGAFCRTKETQTL